MIVVDTNIIVYLYIHGEHSTQTEALLSQDAAWAVPGLWRSEFRNVLALYLRKKLLTLEDALEIIGQAEFLLQDHEYQVSSAKVMQLVAASACSAYDCEFVALAQALKLPLVTVDKKLTREFPATAYTLDAYLHGGLQPR
jgi:predicted nucleic acid-binding protein